MKTNMIQRYPWLSLITVSLLSGLLWRLELEYHGWSGLIWIGYFHWAVPLGFGLFMLWANLLLDLNWIKRLGANIVAIVWGILIFKILHYLFTTRILGINPFIYITIHLVLLITPPFIAAISLTLLNHKPHIKYIIAGFLGMILSIFLAEFALGFFNHKGGSDLDHAIKSGFIIPLWMFSLGIVFVGAFLKKKHEENDLMIEKVEEIGNQK